MILTVGVLAVVLGLVRLIFIPIELLYWGYQHVNREVPTAGFFFFARAIGFCVAVVLAGWLVLAGIRCIRLRRGARRLLIGWALASLAWAICGVSINTFSTLRFVGTRRTVDIVVSVSIGLERWLAGLTFPTVVLVLMSSVTVKEVFEETPLR